MKGLNVPPSRPEPPDRNFEHLRADYNQFLKAYELPTQLYRFLRKRHAASPIYLHRNLSYVRGDGRRRKKTKRKEFRVDDLFPKAQNVDLPAISDGIDRNRSGRLLFTFDGLFCSAEDSQQGEKTQEFTLEPVLTRIGQIRNKASKTRGKYVTKEMKLQQKKIACHFVGDSPVKTPSGASCNLTIPYESLRSMEKSHVGQAGSLRAYVLRLKVVPSVEKVKKPEVTSLSGPPAISSSGLTPINYDDMVWDSTPSDSDEQDGENCPKRFDAQLVLFDAQKKIACEEGDYEIVAKRVKSFGLLISKGLVDWEDCSQVDAAISNELKGKLTLKDHLKLSLRWDGCHPSLIFSYQDIPVIKHSSQEQKPKIVTSKRPNPGFGSGAVKRREPSPGPNQLMLHYSYDGNTRQQSELVANELTCCWCKIKCPSFYGLLKHFQLCHARFTFKYTPHPKIGQIEFRLNEEFSTIDEEDPQEQSDFSVRYSTRQLCPRKRAPCSSVIVVGPKRLKPNLSEFVTAKEPAEGVRKVPVSIDTDRVYYHSTTNMPLSSPFDADSEDEVDPLWMKVNMKMMINEFTDVNDAEKEMMKLWNLHAMKILPFADCHIDQICRQFARKFGEVIIEKNLMWNFAFHLANLSDYRLISPECVSDCMKVVQEIAQRATKET
eukprot:m.18775 g.18775  ORF g.18775 m.18775 type:complete len:660 (+) comp27730_c0_seq1:231-2210(+)